MQLRQYDDNDAVLRASHLNTIAISSSSSTLPSPTPWGTRGIYEDMYYPLPTLHCHPTEKSLQLTRLLDYSSLKFEDKNESISQYLGNEQSNVQPHRKYDHSTTVLSHPIACTRSQNGTQLPKIQVSSSDDTISGHPYVNSLTKTADFQLGNAQSSDCKTSCGSDTKDRKLPKSIEFTDVIPNFPMSDASSRWIGNEASGSERPFLLSPAQMIEGFIKGRLCLSCEKTTHPMPKCPSRVFVCPNCHKQGHRGESCPAVMFHVAYELL
ncbi:putative Rna-binding protein [Cardiosporidium cionae]|uniref:Rna-binding protein n=1 Tax=Cardiosporidium cionae TaxID=476202 RepID=A0ABQ7J9R3_9APIC|nr:putative Rna-binding protein [Cardiosporidium cionae]|eukprot:KAF8820746.1 putative Rna-binding protein [Cardiosporidium cionae]